jgi:hypothetical protein
METLSGDDSATPMITSNKVNPNVHGKLNENARKQAYYYISKLLKKGVIKKTNKYEKQGKNEKPLMIYEVIK